MRPRTYKILCDAIAKGIREGYHKAHRATDDPDREELFISIHNSVMSAIDEDFSFDDDLPNLD